MAAFHSSCLSEFIIFPVSPIFFSESFPSNRNDKPTKYPASALAEKDKAIRKQKAKSFFKIILPDK